MHQEKVKKADISEEAVNICQLFNISIPFDVQNYLKIKKEPTYPQIT